jgi:hypothetical protein
LGNKAITGSGSLSLSASIVAVFLWALDLHPPQEIVLAMGAIVATPLAYAAIYFTPHNPNPGA